MNTMAEVDTLCEEMKAEGRSKQEIISEIAQACEGWPYVFGAWGEQCTPVTRKRRVRVDHPTIKSQCPALNGKTCESCKWGVGVRMFDCRGFTRWVLNQVGVDITGQGATSQYNTEANWIRKGPVEEMPDVVCCVFRKKDNSMEHTGLHIGGGVVVHCSSNVQIGTLDK